MYMNGQIIFDLDKNECGRIGDDSGSTFAWGEHPKHSTHLLCAQHYPKYVEGSEDKIGMGPRFKCENCDNVFYTQEQGGTWIGNGVSVERANEMYKAGLIKPGSTKEEIIARRDERNTTNDEREAKSARWRQKYIVEQMKLGLGFCDRHNDVRPPAYGRERGDHGEFGYRNPHNLRLVEEACKEYLVRIKNLQDELRAKYDPQFIEEDYNDKSLTWPERKAVIDEVWNTPELVKMRGRVK